MKLHSPRLAGHMMALATAFVWGSTFICSKVMLAYYTPVQLMLMRFAVG